MKQIFFISVFAFILVFSACYGKIKPAAGFYQPAEWGGTTLVQTRYGLIQGHEAVSNTFAWKGIPYAKPPVGELRWKAPRDAQPWQGTLAADQFGKPAPQVFPVLFKFTYGSEDCLYLNVWRPRTKEKNLPVYVYIHGGGNSTGSADYENYYGYTLANSMNAVYVSINYRLGPLGWFYHPSIARGSSPEDASGNYGTLDIIQALKWVRANIGSFGGAANRVIVAGESAGAMNVLTLLISPMAKGLFDGAVIESGIDVMNSLDTAKKFSDELIAKMLVRERKAKDLKDAERMIGNMSDAEIKEYLYSKTPDELIRVQRSWVFGMLDAPYIFEDGFVIPRGAYQNFRNGTYPVKVPLIIGSNKDEDKLFLSFDKKVPWNSSLYQAKAKFVSLEWKYRGVDSIAHALSQAKGQPPVYIYRFDWGTVNDKNESVLPGITGMRIGACHALEIPFWMGSGKPAIGIITGGMFTEKNREGREKLTAAMMRYLNAFIRTGNPNSKGLKAWPSWSNGDGKDKAIVFDADYRNPKISYLANEVTMPYILARMQKELQEPVFSEVMETVTNWMLNK